MPQIDDEAFDLARLKRAAAVLMEHFDTVQIFATRHQGDDGTVAACWGEGNWYARRGQIGNWCLKQDADVYNED